jgi:hypothetical protein
VSLIIAKNRIIENDCNPQKRPSLPHRGATPNNATAAWREAAAPPTTLNYEFEFDRFLGACVPETIKSCSAFRILLFSVIS